LGPTRVSASPQVWHVPYRRNVLFTGREDLLHRIHTLLTAQQRTAISQPQAISELGGIGKTQTALEYAYRYRDEYRTVLWVQADSREVLDAELVALARVLGLPEREAQDQSRVVNAIKQWLERAPNCLLILDNADDLSLVQDYLPTTGGAHILITTRARATGALAQRVEVDTMEPEEGAILLLRRAGIVPPDAPLSSAAAADRTQALHLVTTLGGLPLAIDQAGAYIEETGSDLSRYLDLYRTRRHALLKRRGTVPADHPEPVATTWSLSFQQVEQANPAAADLLRVCAFLSPDAIPEELIAAGAAYLGPELEWVARDPLGLDEAIGDLSRFSLVYRHPETQTLSVHRLVQAVLKDEMNQQTQHAWAQRIVQAVNWSFPHAKVATWPACQRYLPHALECAALIEHWKVGLTEGARLLQQAGSYLYGRAQYMEAEPLYQRALAIQEQALGPDHPDTADSLIYLAALYTAQRNYAQAEPLYQRALAIQEQALGPRHPDTAMTLAYLVTLYHKQGKDAQAEPLYQRTLAILCQRILAIQEQILGPDHPDTASTLYNLGRLYHKQGKDAQAELLYQRTLAIQEQVLEPDHLYTASTLYNLGLLYYDRGNYAQAEPLYQRALAIYEQARGPDHPDTADSLIYLAALYHNRGNYAQAEPLYQRALAIYEQARGPDHPDTASTLYNLAALYAAQGNYTQAEPLYQRALAIQEQALGPHHLDTAITLEYLAALYAAQGKDAQAEPLYQRALAIYEQVLAPDHATTRKVREIHTNLLQKIQQKGE